MNIIIGLFLLAHGLVHLLYAGQSLRRFELQPGMTWRLGVSFAFRLFPLREPPLPALVRANQNRASAARPYEKYPPVLPYVVPL